MSSSNTDAPELGDELPAFTKSGAFLETLLRRRSTTVAKMTEPGPSDDDLDIILRIGARVPDHRCSFPFRFIVFTGEARSRFGETLRNAFAAENPGADEKMLALETSRFMRAPCVVAVISSVIRDHKTPEWEQVLTSGAVCQNLLLAANASGYAAQWITEWYTYDANVAQALSLIDGERIAGFVYMGTPTSNPRERLRPDMAAKVSRF